MAAALNGVVGLVLLRAGGRLRSAALRADGRHLFTDVWTTAGVVTAVVLAGLTGWLVLDPLIALVVAANIVRVGVRILNEAAHGLLDTALPEEDLRVIMEVQERYRRRYRWQGVRFHALRTRGAGAMRFAAGAAEVPVGPLVEEGADRLLRLRPLPPLLRPLPPRRAAPRAG